MVEESELFLLLLIDLVDLIVDPERSLVKFDGWAELPGLLGLDGEIIDV